MTALSMPLEILHLAFVLLGGPSRRKRAEISPPPGLGIGFARIQTVFAGLELADHGLHLAIKVSVALLRFKTQLLDQLLLFHERPLREAAIVRAVEIER